MKRVTLLTALVAGVFVSGQAMAADMYEPVSMKDAPLPELAPNWTGFYLGAGIGGEFYNHSVAGAGNFDPNLAPVNQTFAFGDDTGGASVLGTLQIGYDRQFN